MKPVKRYMMRGSAQPLNGVVNRPAQRLIEDIRNAGIPHDTWIIFILFLPSRPQGPLSVLSTASTAVIKPENRNGVYFLVHFLQERCM